MGRRQIATVAASTDLWQATMTEVLQGQDGVVRIPDVREVLAREHDRIGAGR